MIWNCDDAAVFMPITCPAGLTRTARVAWLEGYVGADQPGQLIGDAGRLIGGGDRLAWSSGAGQA